ncbi:MAG: family 43 glycosylhydrolase [Candidatus Merdivicinus sp.]
MKHSKRAEGLYCNPLSIPDYPRGVDHPDRKHMEDYRSLADPTAIYYEGKWYVYPSYGMAFVTEDFVNWEHHPVQPENIGYAPTVLEYRGKFYLLACGSHLYCGDTPLGPFEDIGSLRLPDGHEFTVKDPMLFADDDGSVYLYWGIGDPGIFGAKLDSENLCQLVTEPKILFSFNPEHVWERFGDHNQELGRSSLEGSWMFKRNGRYYLTYTGPGTCYRTYGMGCYISDIGPLDGFRYQPHNPILQNTSGLVKGPGHGCIVEGPNHTLWAFYTCVLCYAHKFERRIGVDPAGIDEDGNLFVRGSSDIPQLAPGMIPHPENGNDSSLLPLTFSNPVETSSCAEGHSAVYALDESMLSWWQPAAGDPEKELIVDLRAYYQVSAIRIIWRDIGLDYNAGILPGPFRYRVDGCLEEQEETRKWIPLLDASDNDMDLAVDFRTFAARKVRYVRLKILGTPMEIEPGVISFTAFGTYDHRL